MGFRTRSPNILHLGIMWENSWSRNTLLTFPCSSPLKQLIEPRKDFVTFSGSRSQDPNVRGALHIPGGNKHLSLWTHRDMEKIWTNRPYWVPSAYYHWILLSQRILFLHSSSSLAQVWLSGLHSFLKAPMSHKMYIKYICILSLVNLSFVQVALATNLRIAEDIFSSTTYCLYPKLCLSSITFKQILDITLLHA